MLLKEIITPLQQRVRRLPVLTHKGARTQALYRWENEEFYDTPAGSRKLSEEQLRSLAQKIWDGEGWGGHYPCPTIKIENTYDNLSYSQGRTAIVLVPKDANAVILIHELVHARGHGVGAIMHPVSFIKVYLRLLNKYLGWDLNELTEKAMKRRLI